MTEIMKIAITKSFLKLGPSNFAWKLNKDPFIATKTCFFVFHNFGVFLGEGTSRKSNLLYKIFKIRLENSFLMLET